MNRFERSPSGIVLITGGAGFIGRNLAKSLYDCGVRVRILDSLSDQVHGSIEHFHLSDGIDFIKGSVCNPGDLQKALSGVSDVIHLAAETGTAQSMYEIAKYSEVNGMGTALLLEAIVEAGDVERVLLASSRSIYGEGAYCCPNCAPSVRVSPPVRTAGHLDAGVWNPVCGMCHKELLPLSTLETDKVDCCSIYAATKFLQEDFVRIACRSNGIGYGILRLQNVYGEGQSLNNPYTGILSIFSTRIRRGLDLPVFEDGMETRDFVHVNDVVEAFKRSLFLSAPMNCELNVGSGAQTSVLDVATALCAVFDRAVGLRVTGEYRLGDIRHNWADTNRLKSVLDFTPLLGLDEGLQRFSSWVLEQPLPEDKLEHANNELRNRNLMK